MNSLPLTFDNSYARLSDRFFERVAPSASISPTLRAFNEPLAQLLGIDATWARSEDGLGFLSGTDLPEGADPIAMAYAGHQYANFVPQLGDGRAILLGELIGTDGVRRDVQLKGAGKTPFSRGGDGRAVLGPVLREYIVSEAMAALGVPTTRALAALTTGEGIKRDTFTPGAIVVRVAQSHVRVGTFQYFAARRDEEGLRELADYVIERHYPEASGAENPYLHLLQSVIDRQADLIAHWQSLGFIHGVMNTDNVSIAGETIDYGPCAFMDIFEWNKVYSSIDRNGRYAFGQQPAIGQWNMAALAQAMQPILSSDEAKASELAQSAVETFPARFESAYLERMCAKIGISELHKGDAALVASLLEAMQATSLDFTLTFRQLGRAAGDAGSAEMDADTQSEPSNGFEEWQRNWRARLKDDGQSPAERQTTMDAVNPAIIPRNHQVAAVIQAAETEDDYALFDRLNAALQNPYLNSANQTEFSQPPTPDEEVLKTFCGT